LVLIAGSTFNSPHTIYRICSTNFILLQRQNNSWNLPTPASKGPGTQCPWWT